jgi:hypothetical protein
VTREQAVRMRIFACADGVRDCRRLLRTLARAKSSDYGT